jgi:hypothetical protein
MSTTVRDIATLTGGVLTLRSAFMALSAGIQSAVEFERQLGAMAQIARSNIGAMRGIGEEVRRLSKQYGVASEILNQNAIELLQSGKSIKEVREALPTLALLGVNAQVGAEGLQEASKAMIVWGRVFGMTMTQTRQAFEKTIKLSKEQFINTSQLIEITTILSSNMMQSNASFEEMLSIGAALRSRTGRPPTEVARGIRTIMARVLRPGTRQFLEQQGVKLFDEDTGRIRGPIKILTDIVALRNAFGRTTEGAKKLELALSGIRRIDLGAALLDSLDEINRNMDSIDENVFELSADWGIAATQMSTKINQVTESFKDLFRETDRDDLLQGLVRQTLDFTNALLQSRDIIVQLLAILGAAGGLAIFRGRGVPLATASTAAGVALHGAGRGGVGINRMLGMQGGVRPPPLPPVAAAITRRQRIMGALGSPAGAAALGLGAGFGAGALNRGRPSAARAAGAGLLTGGAIGLTAFAVGLGPYGAVIGGAIGATVSLTKKFNDLSRATADYEQRLRDERIREIAQGLEDRKLLDPRILREFEGKLEAFIQAVFKERTKIIRSTPRATGTSFVDPATGKVVQDTAERRAEIIQSREKAFIKSLETEGELLDLMKQYGLAITDQTDGLNKYTDTLLLMAIAHKLLRDGVEDAPKVFMDWLQSLAGSAEEIRELGKALGEGQVVSLNLAFQMKKLDDLIKRTRLSPVGTFTRERTGIQNVGTQGFANELRALGLPPDLLRQGQLLNETVIRLTNVLQGAADTFGDFTPQTFRGVVGELGDVADNMERLGLDPQLVGDLRRKLLEIDTLDPENFESVSSVMKDITSFILDELMPSGRDLVNNLQRLAEATQRLEQQMAREIADELISRRGGVISAGARVRGGFLQLAQMRAGFEERRFPAGGGNLLARATARDFAGTANVDELAKRMSELFEELGDASKIGDKPFGSALEQVVNALEALADSSGRLSDIQERLSQAQTDLQAKMGLAEQFFSSDVSGRRELMRDREAARFAIGRGSLTGMSVEAQQAAIRFLNMVSSVRGAGGLANRNLTGRNILEDLLENTVGAKFFAPERDEIADLQRKSITTMVDILAAQKLLAVFEHRSFNVFIQQLEGSIDKLLGSQRDFLDQFRNILQARGIPGFQSGGSTDSVLAKLTPGEFVVNKHSSAKHRALLEAINADHMQGGGVAGEGTFRTRFKKMVDEELKKMLGDRFGQIQPSLKTLQEARNRARGQFNLPGNFPFPSVTEMFGFTPPTGAHHRARGIQRGLGRRPGGIVLPPRAGTGPPGGLAIPGMIPEGRGIGGQGIIQGPLGPRISIQERLDRRRAGFEAERDQRKLDRDEQRARRQGFSEEQIRQGFAGQRADIAAKRARAEGATEEEIQKRHDDVLKANLEAADRQENAAKEIADAMDLFKETVDDLKGAFDDLPDKIAGAIGDIDERDEGAPRGPGGEGEAPGQPPQPAVEFDLELFGQHVAVFCTNIEGPFADHINTFVGTVTAFADHVGEFGVKVDAFGDAVSFIPEEIVLTGKHTVDVNVQGAELFNELDPFIRQIVTNVVNERLAVERERGADLGPRGGAPPGG